MPISIDNFLSNRNFKVRVGTTLSDLQGQEEGVPQGSILPVTLFSIKINNIVKALNPGVDCSLYVDDFLICYRYSYYRTSTLKFNFKLVMDSVEDYARRWSKDEEAELDSLSEWIKVIRRLLKRKMFMACRHVNNKPKSVFNDQVISNLADLHDHYVIVPADKAPNNVVFVCKTYYLSCLKKELDSMSGDLLCQARFNRLY